MEECYKNARWKIGQSEQSAKNILDGTHHTVWRFIDINLCIYVHSTIDKVLIHCINQKLYTNYAQ